MNYDFFDCIYKFDNYYLIFEFTIKLSDDTETTFRINFNSKTTTQLVIPLIQSITHTYTRIYKVAPIQSRCELLKKAPAARAFEPSDFDTLECHGHEQKAAIQASFELVKITQR